MDDGDVAFVIRAIFSPYEIISEKKKYSRQGILYAIDPVVNLATLNYILHGLQRFGFDSVNAKNWNAVWVAFEIDGHFDKFLGGNKLSKRMSEADKIVSDTTKLPKERSTSAMELATYRKMLAQHVVKNLITPFGVPR